MKKIIINENAEKKIVELLLNESMGYANKVKIIKNFLDANFFKADYDEFNSEECKNLSSPLVIPKNTKKGASEKSFTLEQLYYMLQYKYQNIISNKEERNKFIWNVINDWYYNKITNNNNLSKY